MLLRTLSIAALLAMPAAAEQSQAAPVVLELFTSEGCSSCPPADALLAKLHRSPGVDGIDVIVLSEHVDYWNRLGWADPFSSNQFSQRQKWYSSNWPTRMYTPQLVVDGAIEVLGSDPLAVRRSIRIASLAKKASVALISKLRDGRRIDVEIEIADLPIGAESKFELLAAVIEDDISTKVTRGENKGRVLSHVGVVRKLESLGQFTSNEPGPVTIAGSLRIESDWKIGNLRTAVFVQDRESRRIVGAAVALARISHHLTAKARDRCAPTSLRSIVVLSGLSSTPPRANHRPPRIDAPLTHFHSPRGEKCGLELILFT